jgi:thioredoxin reductase
MEHTPLLIVGAGPFGLSLAAYARQHDIEYLMVGRPMHFWQANMPRGMLLRSACDWHLDPGDVDTIEAYLATMGQRPADVEPLTLDFYLSYTRWFQQRQQCVVRPDLVTSLDEVNGRFVATMASGEPVTADNVVLALGFHAFAHIPADIAAMLPPDRYGHTCDVVDLAAFRDKRCLIVGGRQSAFEWTALLHEHGAASVDVCYRHDTPAFTDADWSWFNQQVDEMVDNPGWFRSLSDEEKAAVNARFWTEGRLKLEPWLAPRINHDTVRLWPRTQITACQHREDDALQITLSDDETITVDQVIFATGYKVDMTRVAPLAAGNLLARMALDSGYPRLDEHFETNIPGLFVTSMPAVQDFGLFFAFTISVRASARLIGPAVQQRIARATPEHSTSLTPTANHRGRTMGPD